MSRRVTYARQMSSGCDSRCSPSCPILEVAPETRAYIPTKTSARDQFQPVPWGSTDPLSPLSSPIPRPPDLGARHASTSTAPACVVTPARSRKRRCQGRCLSSPFKHLHFHLLYPYEYLPRSRPSTPMRACPPPLPAHAPGLTLRVCQVRCQGHAGVSSSSPRMPKVSAHNMVAGGCPGKCTRRETCFATPPSTHLGATGVPSTFAAHLSDSAWGRGLLGTRWPHARC